MSAVRPRTIEMSEGVPSGQRWAAWSALQVAAGWLTRRTIPVTYSAMGTAYTPFALVTVSPWRHGGSAAMWSTPANGTWSQRRRGTPERSAGGQAAIRISTSGSTSAVGSKSSSAL